MNSVNGYNNLSFQAKLKVSVPVKDKARLNQIKEIFAQKTQKYPDDVLHISENPDKDIFDAPSQMYHMNIGKPDKYEYPAHLLKDLDVFMAELTDKEIVRKFVKLFKSLKAEYAYSKKEHHIDSSISSLTKALRKNAVTRARYKRLGKDEYAKTYDTLISNNEKRLETLRQQQIMEEAKVAGKLEKITKGDEDLEHIPSVYTIYQPQEIL